MKYIKLTGAVVVTLLIASCFMHWAWYPDLEKYFTGFYSEEGYYGKPGILLSVVGLFGLLTYLFPKGILVKINLAMAGIGFAYAIKSFILYGGGYDGYMPEKQFGLYLMMLTTFLHLFLSIVLLNANTREEVARRDAVAGQH